MPPVYRVMNIRYAGGGLLFMMTAAKAKSKSDYRTMSE